MTEMIERVARRLTATLRHHGVEMHPDDIRGLAYDALAEMRSHTLVYRQDGEMVHEMRGEPDAIWKTLLAAATPTPSEKGEKL
jgi:hypothetical protein